MHDNTDSSGTELTQTPAVVRAVLLAAVTSTWVMTGCAGGRDAARPLNAADQRAIRAVDSAYVASWLRDDTSGVLGTLAPDAVLMPANVRPLTSTDAIKGFWWPRDGSKTKVLTFRRTIEEIAGAGDVAFMRGLDTLVFAYAKDTIRSTQSQRSMTLAVLRRQPDGAWKISRMMWSAIH